MTLYQTPPETLDIDGVTYPVDTDFRVWIEFQTLLTSKASDREKAERLCTMMERMGLPPGEATLDAMLVFYQAASTEKKSDSNRHRPAAFDFQQDSEYIYAAFQGAYGIDLTAARLHWWMFKALFKALPADCELCRIMQYRTIDMKDVPKGQKRFYQEMKARYALTASGGHRTQRDMREYVKRRYEEVQNQMSAMRGNGQPGAAGTAGAGI